MTRSLDTFKGVIARAEKIAQHGQTIGVGDPSDHYRAALVLAVAGFDRYFTHRFADLLATHLKTKEPSDDLIQSMESWGVNTSFLLRLLAKQPERPFRTIRNKVHPGLFRLTTQQTKAIDTLFSKIGIQGLTGKIEKKHGKKSLIKRVNRAVIRRHRIVHEGDLNRNYSENKITSNNLGLYIKALTDYVVVADTLIGESIK